MENLRSFSCPKTLPFINRLQYFIEHYVIHFLDFKGNFEKETYKIKRVLMPESLTCDCKGLIS